MYKQGRDELGWFHPRLEGAAQPCCFGGAGRRLVEVGRSAWVGKGVVVVSGVEARWRKGVELWLLAAGGWLRPAALLERRDRLPRDELTGVDDRAAAGALPLQSQSTDGMRPDNCVWTLWCVGTVFRYVECVAQRSWRHTQARSHAPPAPPAHRQ
jgi:hypothetical protein